MSPCDGPFNKHDQKRTDRAYYSKKTIKLLVGVLVVSSYPEPKNRAKQRILTPLFTHSQYRPTLLHTITQVAKNGLEPLYKTEQTN